jgi:hypothetical protein
MSAPLTDQSSSSVSSSGYVDGLGRRTIAFDRETGEMLERLILRPELAVFEQAVRERVDHLQSLEDERFARPYRIERDAQTGELTVLSEFVAGSRLADLLDASHDEALVAGVDVALGYVLESLPALSTLHMISGITHGVIDPARTVLTPAGQVVFLDAAFGEVVQRLGLSRKRLWNDFGVAAPPGSGPVQLDATADIAQVALSAIMLVLGRPLFPEEYPDSLPSLLMEVVEVAQIRGSMGFAGGLQRILQRSLPLPGRRPYTTADEAVVDVRQLVRREIGLDVCRQALIDFVQQVDTAGATAREADADVEQYDQHEDEESAEERHHEERAAASTQNRGIASMKVLDDFLDRVSRSAPILEEESITEAETIQPAPAAADAHRAVEDHLEDDDDDAMEISLDGLDAGRDFEPEHVYDLSALDLVESESTSEPPPSEPEAEPYREPDAPPTVNEPAFIAAQPLPAPGTHSSEPVEAPAYTPPAVAEEPVAPPPPPAPIEGPAPVMHEEPVMAAATSEGVAPATFPTADSPVPVQESHADDHDTGSSRRRKRQLQKSARARKDKLRSTATPPPKPAPPPPVAKEPAPHASPSGWLISPNRAAAFDPPVPVPERPMPMPPAPVPPAPPVVAAPPAPQLPSFAPTAPGGSVYVPAVSPPSIPMPAYGAPPPPKRAPARAPVAPASQPVVHTVSQPAPVLKLKSEPPAGFAPQTKKTLSGPVPSQQEPVTAPVYRGPLLQVEEPRGFPWKLAGAAVGLVLVATVIGRAYLPGRQAVAGEPGAPVTTTPAPAPAATPAPEKEVPLAADKARLVIQTQPAGIKVMLDRRLVGPTPLNLDVTPGKHVLSFMTSGGEVMHSIKAVAGKTLRMDIPVFSGWVAVFAPIILDIAESGQSIGNTEQNRLMLAPGRHELTFSNRDLGYSAVQVVNISPGEVTTVTLEPKGPVNLNAVPWAEVWLDGQKLGETPLANAQVPLGLREFIFKHPQHGERRVTATIRANAPAAVSVDFTR